MESVGLGDLLLCAPEDFQWDSLGPGSSTVQFVILQTCRKIKGCSLLSLAKDSIP